MPTQAPPATPVLTDPPPPTWFDRYWPERISAAPRVVLTAAIAAAVVGASTITLDRPGIGWLVASIGIAVALVLVARHAGTRLRLSWLLVSLALMAVGAFRAAHWLFVLCVLVAIIAASLAVTDGKSVRGLTFGAFAVLIAAVRALPWIAAGLRESRRNRDGSAPRIGRSVAVSVLLVVVFGSLLASGDDAFAGVVGGLSPEINLGSVATWCYLFGAVLVGGFGACYLLFNPATPEDQVFSTRTVRLTEWAMPVGALVVLFGGFVGVRLTVLFGGRDHVLATEGLTAAGYARSGFWQLAAVTGLTLVVIAIAVRLAPSETGNERLWLRGLLGSLAILTLVITVSALTRIWYYQQNYGFTVLRLLVGVCELWLILVYLMVIVAGVRLRGGWLPRAIVGSAMAFLLGLAVLDPERLIADRNVDRYAETGRIDSGYLSSLSPDAVPALAALPEPMRSCVLSHHHVTFTEYLDDTTLGWNLSRDTARDLLRQIDRSAPCQHLSGR
ncbi:MAG: DUF4173 domain-containing protein [Actinomycetota bacterium]|nr:DUF4173 domain-containing protein [Actinomycetota bacterium]